MRGPVILNKQLQYKQQPPSSIQPSLALAAQSNNNSMAPMWAWQRQQHYHAAAQNGFGVEELQEPAANDNHHIVSTQYVAVYIWLFSYSLNTAAATALYKYTPPIV